MYIYSNLYEMNKKKYLNDDLAGGVDSKQTNIIVATHNARLRCFLEDVMKNKMNEYRKNNNVTEIRLKNCAILKLEISDVKSSKDYKTVISLFHEGTVNKPKKGAYFVTP